MSNQNENYLAHCGGDSNQLREHILNYITPRTSAVWVLRFNGRFRTVEGAFAFSTRHALHQAVTKWLRRYGRYAATNLRASKHTSVGTMSESWPLTKRYRDYIDSLLASLMAGGNIEYVMLEAPIEQPTGLISA